MNLTIPRTVLHGFFEHARQCAPEEACGMVLGSRDGAVDEIIPVTNIDHDPMHYTMNPIEQLRVQKEARRSGRSNIAMVHSHPKGPPRMSKEDLKLAYSPGMVWLLVSYVDLPDEQIDVRAFTVSDDQTATEVPITLVP